MRRRRTFTAALSSLTALLLLVGFTAAPVAALDGGDGAQESASDNEVPEEYCTDVTGLVADEVPFDQVIWVGDLPEDLQPSGVPWKLVTPDVVAAIALGVVPNQCDVLDPNDPPYDPREDELAPDGDAHLDRETDEGSTLIIVNGTVDESADGPGFESLLESSLEENGAVDPAVGVNDGEKDYGIDPGVQYWSDGTIYAENDVVVIGKTAGVEVDCIGEECELNLRGVPSFADVAVPSHSEDDPRDLPEEPDDGTSDGADIGDDAADSADEPDESPTDEGSDRTETSTSDEDDDADGDAGDDESGGAAGDETDQAAGDDVDETAGGATDHRTSTRASGPGFGIGLAIVAVLGAVLLVARRGPS